MVCSFKYHLQACLVGFVSEAILAMSHLEDSQAWTALSQEKTVYFVCPGGVLP